MPDQFERLKAALADRYDIERPLVTDAAVRERC